MHRSAVVELLVDAGRAVLTKKNRKICVVTGSRADYGLLKSPMARIRECEGLTLQLVVTGSHHSKTYGESRDIILADGFCIDADVPLSDRVVSPLDMAQGAGVALQGMAQALSRLQPDLVLLLGDRYEIFATATAACLLNIPLAHLCGGDLTTGAIDDALRHGISKMAHLHFPSNEDAARRLKQMGEADERVFTIGSPGLDAIREMTFAGRAAVFNELGLPQSDRLYLVSLHPETLSARPVADQVESLCQALSGLDPDIALVLSGSNADAGGVEISERLEAFAQTRSRAVFRRNLGHDLYLNVMRQAAMVIGNSSSGLYEAPSFKVPTVNVGRRQDGRLKAASVIDCHGDDESIGRALDKASALDCRDVINPYGDGRAAEKLVDVLTGITDYRALLDKPFVDREFV